MAGPRVVPVRAGGASYDAVVGPGLLASLGARTRAALGERGALAARAFLAFDDKLPDETVNAAAESLTGAGFTVTRRAIAASEQSKTIDAWGQGLIALAAAGHDRSDPVVALGGGVIGDIAGFVAASYRRGVPVVQCPTTLLSMVDASVGGKTGVNLRVGEHLAKNLVGAFHQPALVVADTGTLRSLPRRELRAGLAECLKHAILGAAPGFGATISAAPRVLALDSEAITELVASNVAFKASIVGKDPHERAPDQEGGRALLNLGHTFAHAIETLPGVGAPPEHPGPLLHGEAVALGLIAATATGASLGLAPPAAVDRVRAAVAACGLPARVRGLPADSELISRMQRDKKTLAGRLRVVVPTAQSTGDFTGATLVSEPLHAALEAGWEAVRAAG
jgi:3-dehydroquinate synthetase